MQTYFSEDWEVTEEAAIERQKVLRARIRQQSLETWQTAAAVAFVFSAEGTNCWAAGVLVDRAGRCLRQAEGAARSPIAYTPGLLAYAAGPAIEDVLGQIKAGPDVLLCLGHGLVHPRRCGLAGHIGLIYQRPTVGCAGRVLVGEHDLPGPRAGDWTPVTDGGEVIGAAVRTQNELKPIIVSSGHQLDLPGAIAIVMDLVCDHRWPQPLRRARQLARQYRMTGTGEDI